MTYGLTPETETTLLLCAHFGKAAGDGPAPLEPQEYERLEKWLAERGIALSDLDRLPLPSQQGDPPPIAPTRLAALLERGAAMAMALESWQGRGLWVLSRWDEGYPDRLRSLGKQAPPLLYGAGDLGLLQNHPPALAIVGSRHADEAALDFTRNIAVACARAGVQVVSGAARGIDQAAMGAALEAGGTAAGVLSDSLMRVATHNGAAIVDGQLVLLSPYAPASGFNVGNAMGRNKLIYALASAAVVVSTSAGSGGTWAGAAEALRRGSTPVFVRVDESAPEGNFKLLEEGALAFPDDACSDLAGWLADQGQSPEPDPSVPIQASLW